MNRGEFLMKVIEEKGYNIMSLSRESGVPYTTIRSMIERNLTNASIDNVIKICRALGISVESLNKPDEVDITKEGTVAYITKKPSIELPLYGSISAGALATVEPVIDNVQYISFPKVVLGKYANSNNLFALKVNGESMNKIIPNNSYVICKQIEIDRVKDNDIVIFSHDNEYSMKRFRRDEENQVLIFRSESTDWRFSDIVIPFDTMNDLRIYAKVVWYGVTLD